MMKLNITVITLLSVLLDYVAIFAILRLEID